LFLKHITKGNLAVAIHICVNKLEFQNVDFEEFSPFLLDLMNLNINEMKENFVNLSLKYPDLLDLCLQFQPKLELFQVVKDWILMMEKEKFKLKMKYFNNLKEKMKEIEIKFPQYAEDYWMKKISSNFPLYKHCPLHVKQNKNILKFILQGVPKYFRFSDISLRDDPEIIEMIRKYPNIYYQAYKYLLESERIKYAEEFVTIHPVCFKHVPSIAKTKELAIKMYEIAPTYKLTLNITKKIPPNFFDHRDFIKKILECIYSLDVIPLKILRNIPKDVLVDYLSKNSSQYSSLYSDYQRHDKDILEVVIQNNPHMYSRFDQHVTTSSTLTEFLFEVNPCIFHHLLPKFQTEERCKIFLQTQHDRKFEKFQFLKLSIEISENKELYEFGLNESIENLIMFSPSNENYLQFIVKHIDFSCLKYLKSKQYDNFNHDYLHNFQSMKFFLEKKIFMLIPISFISLEFIEFKEEEDEILCEIFMKLRRMYVGLSYKNSKKVYQWNDVQFKFN
jgi:hypothetical protein